MANDGRPNSRRRRAPRNRGTVLRVEDLRLERQALELKLSGLSYRELADRQGVSVSTAHDRVERGLEHLAPVDTAEKLRQLESERLEEVGGRLLLAIGLASTNTVDHPLDVDSLVKAATAYSTLSARKAKLLGLDLPVQQSVKITSEVDARIEQLVAELAGEVDPDHEPALAEP